MTMRVVALGVIALLPVSGAEPPPRAPAELPLRVEGALGHITGAYELPDGRVLLTDEKRPAVSVLDPKTGQASVVGSAGVGPGQYVRPGGIYGGGAREILVLDRAQTSVHVFSTTGAYVRTYSIAVAGVTSSSDGVDLQRLDGRGHSYFTERSGRLESRLTGGPPAPAQVIRFDPVKQQRTVVTDLRQPDTKTVPGGDGMVFSRAVVGSPADGFGVAPDGRVAAVRAEPYRVEWVAVDGKVTTGPAIAVDTLPMTDADKAEYKAKYGGAGGATAVGVGSTSGRGGLSGLEPTFAATKAPFSPADVIVSPNAHVWVLRTRPAGATTAIYDVFDASGRRVDRLEFPAGSRVAGFGANTVYITDEARSMLKKYKVR